MKHCHFSHFLYRAFHSPGFRLSTGLGFIVAVCQIVQMFSPVDTGFSYPSSLYEMWLGGEWASYASALVFLLLPLFATLPFSSSLAEDKKSGYLIQLLIRGKRLSVFFSICCQHLFIRLCCCGASLFGKSFSECSHLSRTHAAAFHLYLFTVAARVYGKDFLQRAAFILFAVCAAHRHFLWRFGLFRIVTMLFHPIARCGSFAGICGIFLGLLSHHAAGMVFSESLRFFKPHTDRGFSSSRLSHLCHWDA